jgi:hypothetical protein
MIVAIYLCILQLCNPVFVRRKINHNIVDFGYEVTLRTNIRPTKKAVYCNSHHFCAASFQDKKFV